MVGLRRRSETDRRAALPSAHDSVRRGIHMKRLRQTLHAITRTLATILLLNAASLALPGSVWTQPRSRARPPAKAAANDELGRFLAAPLDLAAFKRKKGGSLNEGIDASPWFYRPRRPGFFYKYMMFDSPLSYSEVERLSGFSVVVYKLGSRIGDYNDTNEVLVAIWCRLKDPDLGQADLVGRPVSEVTARFGEPFARVGDVLVYQRHRRALSVHTSGGAVDWFKYVALSREIDTPDVVPELLLQTEWPH